MIRTRLLSLAIAAMIVLTTSTAHADSDEDARVITQIRVWPETIQLDHRGDEQTIVVLATTGNGVHVDVTDQVTLAIADEQIATATDARISPRADGATTIVLSYEGQSAELPVTVRNAGAPRPVSYRLDVIPVFMSAGCNSGGCHGSARGQDGFRLSLFGFDPVGDWQRITREMPGRRVNRAMPDASLLLRKATGEAPHTGGRRIKPGSAPYNALRDWIATGAQNDCVEAPAVTAVNLYPPRAVLAGSDQNTRCVVVAEYADGTNRDVTDLAVFRTNNDVSLEADANGTLRSGNPGEAFITASFDTFTVGSPYIVLTSDGSFTLTDPADGRLAANYIDEHIASKLTDLRMQPSDLCSDEVFIRRVYLDVIGLLPTPEQRNAFIADTTPDKRARTIDELLERREFAQLWVMQWAELLQIRSNNDISQKAALLYFEYVRQCIADNVPVDEMVRRILGASGGTFAEPATNFYQNNRDTLVLMENVAQAFMGVRVQCAQCHNHPFDRWTQDDYYGFAAFFSQVGRKRAEDPRETIIFDRRRGEARHPVDNRVMQPKFLGGLAPDIGNRDRREVVAQWLTSPENPFFARSLANRVWAHFMGVGIVEPVDDFRVSNPASNDPLLAAMAAKLVEYDFDFKRLVRDICNSRAYQRSTARLASNAHDERNYAHALVRRLRSETLLDVITQVTEVPQKLPGLPLGSRAVEVADGSASTYFLTTFGRSSRDTVCACEVSREPSLGQALHLLNGDTINRAIVQGKVINRMLEDGSTPEQVFEALYVRCLCRAPSDEERAAFMQELEHADDSKVVLEDAFWAILNASEFVFNH